MANIIYARVMQKTATLSEWMSSDLVLLDGEQAFVVSSDGTPINFKIGDGTKTFSELPFWIQYDQAQYISVESNALPTPTQDVGYSLVGSGTYTKSGQSDVVVPSGHMGILNWDGSVWYLGSSVKTIKGEKGDVGPMGPKGDVGEKGDALAITGVVEDYSDLSSLSGLQEGDSYVVNSNGKLYIYNGDSFPSESEGIDLGLDLDVVPPRGENIFNQ